MTKLLSAMAIIVEQGNDIWKQDIVYIQMRLFTLLSISTVWTSEINEFLVYFSTQ